jgi:hypothetical protein
MQNRLADIPTLVVFDKGIFGFRFCNQVEIS